MANVLTLPRVFIIIYLVYLYFLIYLFIYLFIFLFMFKSCRNTQSLGMVYLVMSISAYLEESLVPVRNNAFQFGYEQLFNINK